MQIQDWQGHPHLKLAIGTDHGGYELKCKLIPYLQNKGIEVIDCGPFEFDPKDDYPCFAHPVAQSVVMHKADIGLLICRSGVGMGIAANRYPGVRAVVAYTTAVAKASRCHNCSNVLVLPADYADEALQMAIIDTWFSTPFEGSRHVKRLTQIENGSWYPVSQVELADPELGALIAEGFAKNQETLDLVASENRASNAVKAALGSYLTDKYAEGNVKDRHYPDCDCVDAIEQLCIQRACDLFHAEAANVQPYSGSLANLAVYTALLQPGDPVLALNPSRGGHSTHFSKNHISGLPYKVSFYEPNSETELLDYNIIEKMVLASHPKLILAGGSAYPREIDFAKLRKIADRVGAKLMVDMAHVAGLVAAGLYPSPVPYADVVTSTTHKTLRGPRGGLILCKKEYINAINYAVFPMIQGGPLVHVIAAKAVALKEASTPEFATYAQSVIANARALADAFKTAGLRIVTDGTDCHMIILDVRPLNLTGTECADALEKANINVNPMRISCDDLFNEKAVSGIRIGTPVITTLGMCPEDMPRIAQWVLAVAQHPHDEALCNTVRTEISNFLKAIKKTLIPST